MKVTKKLLQRMAEDIEKSLDELDVNHPFTVRSIFESLTRVVALELENEAYEVRRWRNEDHN